MKSFINNILLLICGPSGCGKSRLTEELSNRFNLSILNSYTNRPQRTLNEKGHIFLDLKKEDCKLLYPRRIAETVFNNYFYFATEEQADNNQLYIIDLYGIEYLKTHYENKLHKKIVSIGLNTSSDICFKRMLERGDSIKQAKKRLEHDKFKFNFKNIDLVLNTEELEERIKLILDFLNM